MNLPSHKTKIICTIGPASRSKSVLRELIKKGMNVARLNFSHGTLEEHRKDIRLIRSISKQESCPVTILIDLPGPKIRIGKLKNEPMTLKKGAIITLTTKQCLGTPKLISVSYKRLPESVSKGSIIYINDGFIQLKVQDLTKHDVRCKVIIGGNLLSHKGLNIPKGKIFLEPVTKTDLEHIDLGLKEGVDTFSVSFVKGGSDIRKVKQFAKKRGHDVNVVAKIECVEAVDNIDEILDVADAIMVARGDLGVQFPIEDIPAIQKRLIHKANRLGLPVITATQMLESMVGNIRPTRAEVTDVANAILDGTDAVMLSEETAIGAYPIETLKMMVRIATSIENERSSVGRLFDVRESLIRSPLKHMTIEDVLSLNVIEATKNLKVRHIVTPTNTGNTPRRISRFKAPCWILAFSKTERTHRFLAFSYGVYSFFLKDKRDSRTDLVKKLKKDLRVIKKGDKIILTEGVSAYPVGTTDSLRIVTIT